MEKFNQQDRDDQSQQHELDGEVFISLSHWGLFKYGENS